VPRKPGRGQALTEFALVLPIMLLLLLGIADFGRLFAAGIVVRAASRDGAEAAAQLYVQLDRTTTMSATDIYAAVRAKAEAVGCGETQGLWGATVDGSGTCTSPAIAVCVHDAGVTVDGTIMPGDPSCGQTLGALPADLAAGCGGLAQPWSTAPDVAGLPSVEVRVCYPFSTLVQAQILPIGPVYLQQSSRFVAATY
jgi:hypothetical protein